MDTTTSTIALIFLWIIVPCIMLGWLLYALSKARTTSSRAGFWAGLVIFVVFVISQLGLVRTPDLNPSALPQLELLPLLGGALVGFVILFMVRIIKADALMGIVTLLLSAASSIALFSYIFMAGARNGMGYLALGTVFGALLFVVFFPQRD
jgi:hypothetical protein